MTLARRRRMAVLIAVVLSALCAIASPARAVDPGQPAPDFKLPSTTGADVSLSDFHGKRWVLLEFYAADFVPT